MRAAMTTAELGAVIGRPPTKLQPESNRTGSASDQANQASPSALPPRVLVVGDAPDLDRALADFDPTRTSLANLSRVATDGLDVAVVDTRLVAGATPAPPLVALAERLPVILVSAEPGDDERLDAIGDALAAAGVVSRPIRTAALTRAIRTAAELRRIRRALTVTNAALAHSVTGVAIADPRREDTPIVYVSPMFEAMTGYAASEVLDKNCRFLAGQETDPPTRERIRQTIAAREPGRFVLRNFKKDGTPFWNELTIFPIYDEGGELLYIGGLQHDVTDLITARAELARTRDQLVARQALTRDVLDGVPVAVVTTDEELRVTVINRAACALLGTSPDRCIGLGLEDALDLSTSTIEALEEARAGRSRAELSFPLRGSMPREIGISMRRAAGEQGFFIVLRDLVESRQAERIERLAAVSTMAAGFAHEVRNPLASLRMLCEMLQAEIPREDPHQDLVLRMMNQVARVERLVRTSLQFARPQKPRKGDHWASVVLNSVLEALAPRLRTVTGEIELQVSEDLPKIQCDDAQLVQILVVLANNAIDAGGTAEGVILRVNEYVDEAGTPGERWVRFSVEDSGPGIPEHQRAAIFHPFFTTKPSGTGLGLSIAQQLVHENGGRIELGAKTGRGAVFTVLIPALHTDP